MFRLDRTNLLRGLRPLNWLRSIICQVVLLREVKNSKSDHGRLQEVPNIVI